MHHVEVTLSTTEASCCCRPAAAGADAALEAASSAAAGSGARTPPTAQWPMQLASMLAIGSPTADSPSPPPEQQRQQQQQPATAWTISLQVRSAEQLLAVLLPNTSCP
jgi:hypothetical protein